MLFALVNGQATRATPEARARCPFCDETVIAKCGEIVIWHWAHEAGGGHHDPWWEESQWHLGWKEWALEQGWRVEVQIERDSVRHVADVVTPSGWVIELQHSSIDPATIGARERFYGRMVWLWDTVDAADERMKFNYYEGGKVSVRWKHPRWSVCVVHRPSYFDIGHGDLLHGKFARRPSRYYDGDICLGRGTLIDYSTLRRRYDHDWPPPGYWRDPVTGKQWPATQRELREVNRLFVLGTPAPQGSKTVVRGDGSNASDGSGGAG
jgi:hypothetical protein